MQYLRSWWHYKNVYVDKVLPVWVSKYIVNFYELLLCQQPKYKWVHQDKIQNMKISESIFNILEYFLNVAQNLPSNHLFEEWVLSSWTLSCRVSTTSLHPQNFVALKYISFLVKLNSFSYQKHKYFFLCSYVSWASGLTLSNVSHFGFSKLKAMHSILSTRIK